MFFQKKIVILQKNKMIMATPIRFAPVLIGKEAEEFYDRWQKSLKKTSETKFDKKEYEKVKDLIAEYDL